MSEREVDILVRGLEVIERKRSRLKVVVGLLQHLLPPTALSLNGLRVSKPHSIVAWVIRKEYMGGEPITTVAFYLGSICLFNLARGIEPPSAEVEAVYDALNLLLEKLQEKYPDVRSALAPFMAAGRTPEV